MDPWIRMGDRDTLRQVQRRVKRIRSSYPPGVYRIRPHKDAHSGYERFIIERKRDGLSDVELHRLFGW